jgi:hypothetical protein
VIVLIMVLYHVNPRDLAVFGGVVATLTLAP